MSISPKESVYDRFDTDSTNHPGSDENLNESFSFEILSVSPPGKQKKKINQPYFPTISTPLQKKTVLTEEKLAKHNQAYEKICVGKLKDFRVLPVPQVPQSSQSLQVSPIPQTSQVPQSAENSSKQSPKQKTKQKIKQKMNKECLGIEQSILKRIDEKYDQLKHEFETRMNRLEEQLVMTEKEFSQIGNVLEKLCVTDKPYSDKEVQTDLSFKDLESIRKRV